MRFYFGASGSHRMHKALRKLDEPNVMINYASRKTDPWDGIDRLFIDSGGYSFLKGKGEYETTEREYIEWVADADPDLFALRDYPCEPDLLDSHDRTVADHQQMSVERHLACLDEYADSNIDGQPVAVLQGWELSDYLECIDRYRDHGLLTEYIGIGSVCRRNQDKAIRRIINRIADELPNRQLHAFGVKRNIVQYPDMVEVLASGDSQAFAFQTRMDAMKGNLPEGTTRTWKDVAREYLNFRHDVLTTMNSHEDQSQLEGYV